MITKIVLQLATIMEIVVPGEGGEAEGEGGEAETLSVTSSLVVPGGGGEVGTVAVTSSVLLCAIVVDVNSGLLAKEISALPLLVIVQMSWDDDSICVLVDIVKLQ